MPENREPQLNSDTTQNESAPAETETESTLKQIQENVIFENHDEKVEKEKEFISGLLKEWAESQDMEEGTDFVIPKIEDYETLENTSPHELTNVYFGFKTGDGNEGRLQELKRFFEKEYKEKMQPFNEWDSDVKINYSWAGRFCIEGAGGPAIDTAPLESVDPMVCKTHHQEFKDFFKQEAGFDLPSPEQLDEILGDMSDNLDWYRDALKELNNRIFAEDQKAKNGGNSEAYKYRPYQLNLEYVVRILEHAELEKERRKLGTNGDKKLVELPEVISEETGGVKLDEKVRHYNDLTYNADDFKDLDDLCGELGLDWTPPTGKNARIDKIYEDNFPGFKRDQIEEICRKFSEKLYK